MTSKQSAETLENMLNEANNFHPNIKLTGVIRKCVAFLDVCIENKHGILSTFVYHKESAEPYAIPFKSDHSRHTFANIIRGALARAVRLSSTLTAFDDERRNIRLTLLYNGYFVYFSFLRVHYYAPLVIHHDLLTFITENSFLITV